MGSVSVRNIQQTVKFVLEKHFVVQRFILIVCNNHAQEIAYYAEFVKNKWANEYLCITFLYFLIPFLKICKVCYLVKSIAGTVEVSIYCIHT